MDGNSEIPRHTGEEFETLITENALRSEVLEVSNMIFKDYILNINTDLALVCTDPYSIMFLIDVFENIKVAYEKNFPNKKFEDSKISGLYAFNESFKPTDLQGKKVCLISAIIDKQNLTSIQSLQKTITNHNPKTCNIYSLISTLPDSELQQIDSNYTQFPLPQEIEILGYGIGTPDPRMNKRIMFKAKEV